MNVEVGKADVDPFLWFQRLVERRLLRETLRRAKASGLLPETAESLWCGEVDLDQYGCYDVIFVSFDVPTGDRRPFDRKQHIEEYTLAEALRLCVQEEEG